MLTLRPQNGEGVSIQVVQDRGSTAELFRGIWIREFSFGQRVLTYLMLITNQGVSPEEGFYRLARAAERFLHHYCLRFGVRPFYVDEPPPIVVIDGVYLCQLLLYLGMPASIKPDRLVCREAAIAKAFVPV